MPPQASLVCAAGQVCPWSVSLVDKSAAQSLIRVEAATTTADFNQSHQVFLRLATPIPAEYESVVVTLLLAKAPSRPLQTRQAKNARPIEPLSDPTDATLYASGIIAPAAGAATTYTIDARAVYAVSRDEQAATAWSIGGTVKTDKRPNVDPDSFTLYGNFTKRSLPYTRMVDVGTEFVRNDSVFNLLAAPRVVRTFAHSFLQDVPAENGNIVRMLRGTVGLDAWVGLEVGANLKHDETIDPSGLVLRFVPRAKAYVIVPAARFVKKVVVGADYVARLLASDEVLVDTRPGASPVPVADTRVRHHIEVAATANLTDWIGLKVSYEYGSLPPTFKLVNHSGKVTLVFQAKQNER
jgi:hypothetical protein